MQRVFRVVDTRELEPSGAKVTAAFIRSVRRHGVVNPVLLAEVVDDDGVIGLTVVDGNRRVRAAKAARLPKIPAVVLKETTAQERARLTLLCNYMRSLNFHTESEAILTLASDEDAAGGAARAIGLGPVKIQQLYRKIATMPEPVRRAMYEDRIPVTAAGWVAGWPEGLQRELIDLLERRSSLNTRVFKDLRASYAERHPEEFAPSVPTSAPPGDDGWNDWDVDVVHLPASPGPPMALPRAPDASPARSGGIASPPASRQAAAPVPGGTGDDALPSHQAPEASPEPLGNGRRTAGPPDDGLEQPMRRAQAVDPGPTTPLVPPAPGPSQAPALAPAARPTATAMVAPEPPGASATVDDHAERMVAFVARLDTALRELAGEGRALGIGRHVWVDRAMRAWDGGGA